MLLLCLFWLTFPFYLNAQDGCSVFHEGACPLEVNLFFRLIVIAIIVVCKNQIFYKNYPVIVAQNDGLCEKVICWDCTLVYFNFQCSLLFPFVILSWQSGVTILKTSLSSYRYHYLLRWICFFFVSLSLSFRHENTSYLYPYTGVKHLEWQRCRIRCFWVSGKGNFYPLEEIGISMKTWDFTRTKTYRR